MTERTTGDVTGGAADAHGAASAGGSAEAPAVTGAHGAAQGAPVRPEFAPPPIAGTFRTDDEARAVYSEAAGIARVMPRAVAVPAGADDVSALVRWARETGTPLVPRGSGTSMGGGAVGDGVIIDLSRFREIGAVDVARKRVRAGAGVLRGEVEQAARAVGLRFPPDPSSGAYCTIGGMVSTNAAGSHTLKYGMTREWVAALDCVFDDGTRATIARGAPVPAGIPALERFAAIAERVRDRDAAAPVVHHGVKKDSSGYNVHPYARSGELVDLLVGGEGTLCIVTGAELMLTEAPGATSSLLGAFATLDDAVEAATRARDAGASACELLDRTFLDVAADGMTLPDVPAGTEAVLLAEVEAGTSADATARARALADHFTASRATRVALALTPVDEHDVWALRHAASPILARLDPALASMQFIEDGAVPPAKLAHYVRGIREILAAHETRGVIFGHAGDSHVHVNPLVDTRRPGWRDTVRAILDDVVALTARLGGTLAGEHGDGRLRTPLLERVWSREAASLFAMVKRTFDPAGIFNPGVKVPLPGQSAITDIKYDPELPPLPPRAADALAAVARDRAYHKFRLDLIAGSA